MDLQDDLFIVDASGGGDLVIAEDTSASPQVEDESPESPTAEILYDGLDFPKTVTRVRIESSGEGDDDVVVEGVGFAIDCVGRTTDEEKEQGSSNVQKRGGKHFPPEPPRISSVTRDADCEVVGAISSQPCCSSSIRREQIHPTTRGTREDTSNMKTDDDVMPLYEVEPDIVITGVSSLSDSAEETPKPAKEPPRQKHTCWNCEGDHMISMCQQRRDPQRIAANRTKFLAAKNNNPNRNNENRGFQNQNRRYHEDVPHPSDSCKPGYLSPELRQIMGLAPDRLPLHIYRMRIYGYPPGWLEMATEESCSGLKLYGQDTISMQLGTPKRGSRVNPDNIYAYPGFNAPIPPGMRDESRELGFPRFSEKDSIANMLKNLNYEANRKQLQQSLRQNEEREKLHEKPESWEFNSLDRVDQPTTNSGKWHGVGRGRYQEPPKLPAQLGYNRPVINSNSLVVGAPTDGFGAPLPVDKVFRTQVNLSLEASKVDSRYLPRRLKSKSNRKRSMHGRSSPSLLGPADPADKDRTEYDEHNVSSPESPVILNLPPAPASPERAKGIQMMDCDDSDDATGSSGDILRSPKPKRRKVADIEDDDDVMIITEDDGKKASDSDDCVLITSAKVITPGTATDSTPKENPGNLEIAEVATSNSKKVHDIVQLDSQDSNSGSDWGATEKRQKEPTKLRKNVSGSSTGDEAEINEAIANRKVKKFRKKKRKGGSEDWEQSSDSADDNSNSGRSVEELSKKKEFVPCNARLEAIKEVLLANVENEDGGGGGGGSSENSFSALPSYEKFAQGMPAMTFEEEPPERTGRLDKVLKALKSRGETRPNNNQNSNNSK